MDDKEGRPRRETTQSRRMDDYISIGHIPTNAEDCEDAIRLRRVVVELTDCFWNELDARFASANTVLWLSMCALSPNRPQFCEFSALKPYF